MAVAQKQIEKFKAESAAMNEKWKKIAATKRARRQNSKISD